MALKVEVDGLAAISGRLGDLLSSLRVGGNKQGRGAAAVPDRPFLAAEPVKLARQSVKAAAEGPKLPAEGVTAPQQRILDAMAKLSVMGVDRLEKVQVAAVAGVVPSSGSFANNLGRLRSLGLIDYPQPGVLAFTAAGEAAARSPDAPPSIEDLHAAWLDLLTNPQRSILRALLDCWPAVLTKPDLAQRVGVVSTSGSFANNLGRLRTLGVIDYPAQGQVRAEDVLFPDLGAR